MLVGGGEVVVTEQVNPSQADSGVTVDVCSHFVLMRALDRYTNGSLSPLEILVAGCQVCRQLKVVAASQRFGPIVQAGVVWLTT